MLATIRIVKTTVCTRSLRSLLMLSSGRINSIAAPVVPMNEARPAPMANATVLLRGVARMSPDMKKPPATTNRANSSEMNWTYSTNVWNTVVGPSRNHIHTATGIPSTSARANWNRTFSHRWAVRWSSGSTAILASMMTKGISPRQGTSMRGLPCGRTSIEN